jgi:hypothetical protein
MIEEDSSENKSHVNNSNESKLSEETSESESIEELENIDGYKCNQITIKILILNYKNINNKNNNLNYLKESFLNHKTNNFFKDLYKSFYYYFS